MGEKLLIGLLRSSFVNGEKEFHGGRGIDFNAPKN